MAKRKLLILEDQSLALMDLADRVRNFYDFEIIEATRPELALQHKPDIAICDIELGNDTMDGVDVANELNRTMTVPIIFVTMVQDDSRIFQRIESADYPKFYLSKPIANNALKIALLNAEEALEEELSEPATDQLQSRDDENLSMLQDRVYVRNGRGKVSVKVDDMLWWQSGGGESSMVVTKDRLAEGKGYYPTVGYNLSKLEEKLAFYPYFIRCSRYHIVNLTQVQRVLDDAGSGSAAKKALLVAGQELPVGEKYRKEVMRRLHIL